MVQYRRNFKYIAITASIFILVLYGSTLLLFSPTRIEEPPPLTIEDMLANTSPQESQPLNIVNGMAVGAVSSFDQILESFPKWASNYDGYSVTSEDKQRVKEIAAKIAIKLFIGTWCPMATASVPPFMKTLKEAGNPNIEVTIRGVDRLKTDPEGIAQDHGIQRVPTLIFVDPVSGKEIKRIVERPISRNFVQDLLDYSSEIAV